MQGGPHRGLHPPSCIPGVKVQAGPQSRNSGASRSKARKRVLLQDLGTQLGPVRPGPGGLPVAPGCVCHVEPLICAVCCSQQCMVQSLCSQGSERTCCLKPAGQEVSCAPLWTRGLGSQEGFPESISGRRRGQEAEQGTRGLRPQTAFSTRRNGRGSPGPARPSQRGCLQRGSPQAMRGSAPGLPSCCWVAVT